MLGRLGADLHVVRNDGFTLEEVEQLQPAGIIFHQGLVVRRKQACQ